MARSNKPPFTRRPEDWFPPVRPTATPTNVDVATSITTALAAVDINTTAPITGGGNLSGDLTLALSGTRVQFNAACSDGDFLYVGDITQYTDEMARDALGAALVAGTNITLTVNDAGDTITIDATGGGGGGAVEVLDEGVSLSTSATSINFVGAGVVASNSGDDITVTISAASSYTNEEAQDAVGGILTDSTTIDFTYNDGAPSITADVKPNSIPIGDLSDVDTTTDAPIDRDGFGFDTASGLWVPRRRWESSLKRPRVADFTWFNQGAAAATDVANGISFDGGSSATQIRLLRQTTVASYTSFTMTARLANLYPFSGNGYTNCLVLRNSANNRIIIMGFYISGTQFLIQQWSATNSYNADIRAPATMAYAGWPWLRITVSGGTITFWVSPDGVVWHAINSTSTATYLSAIDQIGIGCMTASATVKFVCHHFEIV